MSPSHAKCKEIAEDTLSRVDSILHLVREGSLDSTFIKEQLPPLNSDQCPRHPTSKVKVVNADAFTVARDIIRRTADAKGKTAVLNLASDEVRAGGWLISLSKTQEEALCYSSTLYPTLKDEYYPWPNMGPKSIAGIYSPAVVIFKDDLDHDCVDLPPNERQVVSVITVAAPRDPPLSRDGQSFKWPQDLECMRQKIRLVYRMAAHNGQHHLVLGAMGCGVYYCPAGQVADEMKAILLEEEFVGWFKEVIFAVYSTRQNSNFDLFTRVLNDVELRGMD